MAKVRVTADEVRIALSPWEKVAALHGDLRLPRRAVCGVEVLDDSLTGVRGVRAPGLRLPRSRAIGTWRHRHGKDFVVARRAQGGLRLVLSGSPWSAVLISLPDPRAVAEQLR